MIEGWPAKVLKIFVGVLRSPDFGINVLSVMRTNGKKATRPCPCGYYGDAERACRCTQEKVKQYQQRITGGPMFDRAYFRILKIARTIADLAGSEHITRPHLFEAINYRRFDIPKHGRDHFQRYSSQHHLPA